MVLHGIALHLMILHSLACHCIVPYGVAWYCIVGFGPGCISQDTYLLYYNDCDNCNDDSDDIIENMTVIMAQMIKIFSSGNPKSSVRVWPYIWLGFQGNPDWMIMMMMMTVMIMMTMMMTTMMTIKTNAGKTNGKADGRGGEDGRWALQASYGAHRLDWQIKALSTFWSRSSIL